MFKGLISLFASGVIFSPFVLLGVVSGGWCYFNLAPEGIRDLFFKNEFYVAIVSASIVYVLLFARVYERGGNSLDWVAMLLKMVSNVIKFIASFLLVMSFISLISIF